MQTVSYFPWDTNKAFEVSKESENWRKLFKELKESMKTMTQPTENLSQLDINKEKDSITTLNYVKDHWNKLFRLTYHTWDSALKAR